MVNTIAELRIKGFIGSEAEIKQLTSGTTDGQVYAVLENGSPSCIIKYDHPTNIGIVARFLESYKGIGMLPNLYDVDSDKKYFLYEYIEGTTHFNRGKKADWMKLLVEGMFNHYEKCNPQAPWGRVGGTPRQSWFEFNRISLEYAYENVGNLLPGDDYLRMKELAERLATNEIKEEKYYLHGDTGVHNFVFHQNQLVGVIDPDPLIGPLIYDFTYAFCSSPDDLDMETLLASFALLKNVRMDTQRLIEEVVFQLYTRIGICKKAHPHDLEEYLQAWEYWKRKLKENN
ncbi:phosphotransferase [Sporosarcina thermotolerans]|uniref:Phosphotransferase n=1 Tax=Sporosarcina thermotolerans TaxID=633404 RepID=A0AAW9ABL1_9BACL|nr:phosphotransferase [Sporosarcina thermotolerans]MDW0118802.1 phosphotransferase [Sporosarcina thermotolerans]WHT48491.1 phosphotransferase [Sporosarcina thermotolerans]